MNFRSKLLPDYRWGIYEGGKLLATIGCRQECQKILKVLQQRRSGSLRLSKEFQEQFQLSQSDARELA